MDLSHLAEDIFPSYVINACAVFSGILGSCRRTQRDSRNVLWKDRILFASHRCPWSHKTLHPTFARVIKRLHCAFTQLYTSMVRGAAQTELKYSACLVCWSLTGEARYLWPSGYMQGAGKVLETSEFCKPHRDRILKCLYSTGMAAVRN